MNGDVKYKKDITDMKKKEIWDTYRPMGNSRMARRKKVQEEAITPLEIRGSLS